MGLQIFGFLTTHCIFEQIALPRGRYPDSYNHLMGSGELWNQRSAAHPRCYRQTRYGVLVTPAPLGRYEFLYVESGDIIMRKRIITPVQQETASPDLEWLNMERLAEVEIASEDAAHPIESALLPVRASGWRAAGPGKQTIRLLFDYPQSFSGYG
jgi:hypothetical protein